jgi:hypothetical protein
MTRRIIELICFFCLFSIRVAAQKFYLGNYLMPTNNEFELLGISSETGVASYRYTKAIYDKYYEREIDDIIVGLKNGYIVTTVYSLIPRKTDVGTPSSLVSLIQSNFPYQFREVNGIYGLNIDNESISFGRTKSALTFWKDRIVFVNTVKHSILKKQGDE